MPRKTRQQKKMAEKRKRQQIVHIHTHVRDGQSKATETTPVSEIKFEIKKPVYQETPEETMLKKQTVRDIFKTCVIMSLLIVLQFVFFYWKSQV